MNYCSSLPFWDLDEMNQQEKEKVEEFIKNRIDTLKSYYPKEEVAKYVDFPAEKFDLVLDLDKRNGIALVSDIIRRESDREMIREDLTDEDEEEDLDESRVITSLNMNPWYQICHPRIIFSRRTYRLANDFHGSIDEALGVLKTDMAGWTGREDVGKMSIEEISSLLKEIDKSTLENFENHRFNPAKYGLTSTWMRVRMEEWKRSEESEVIFDMLFEVLKEKLMEFEDTLEPEYRWISEEVMRWLNREQNEWPFISPTELQDLLLNYLWEYDPKRKIALVANCELAKHRGCWNELIFANVALIGKAWYNFLPPAYANKSIDEGIRWMCWMEEGDYFVKEV